MTAPQSQTVLTDLTMLRQYLRGASPESGMDILRDYIQGMEPGAGELLHFCLQLRNNPRTRRSEAQVRYQWQLQESGQAESESRWLRDLCQHLIGMWRQWRKVAFPTLAPAVHPQLSQSLPRASRRALQHTGMVQAEMPSLALQARTSFDQLEAAMVGQQVVVWLDNWYCERFGVDPEQPVHSTDLSAAAVLLLSTADERPADRTRSHSLPHYSNTVNLHHLTVRVDAVATEVSEAMQALVTKVQRLEQHPPQRASLRVPLDLQRPQRAALQWRALTLSRHRVSANTELLSVLKDLLALRERTRNVVPLLVDEKVHYAVLRMQLARAYSQWDVQEWMRDMPLLYGVCTESWFSKTMVTILMSIQPFFFIARVQWCFTLNCAYNCSA